MGPDTVLTDTGLAAQEKVGTDTELAEQEKVGTDTELAGKASEKDGAAGEDTLAADRGVAEAAGMEKIGPGGWKELMEDMGAAGEGDG